MTKARGPSTVQLKVGDRRAYRTARLIVTPAGEAPRSVVLGVPQVRIGAGSSNDIIIEDPHASRFHCEIRKTHEGFLLRDLGSLNGTRVGDVVIKEGLLQSGATITVGETRIQFLADDGKPEEVMASPRQAFGEVVGKSLRMRELFGVLERVAPTELTLLVGGETGSGKDVVARAVHAASPRARGPFVVFDCAAVAPTLIESELFGHVKGAFTGAAENREGAFERADKGTLFLDEIGELSLDLQPKLLRVLEQRQVRPVGGGQERPVDVRIIAATHKNLENAVKDGKLRQDLFFRLSVVSVEVPSLRQRLEDLPLLIESIFSQRASSSAEPPSRLFGSLRSPHRDSTAKPMGLSPEAMAILQRYDWPGNVRELRNVVETAAAVCDGERIEPKHLIFFKPRRRDPTVERLPLAGKSLESIERAAIAQTLEHCGGNKTRAAKVLGISASTLYEKVKKYSL